MGLWVTEMEENERAVTETLLLLASEEEEDDNAEAMRELVVIESNSASLHSYCFLLHWSCRYIGLTKKMDRLMLIWAIKPYFL